MSNASSETLASPSENEKPSDQRHSAPAPRWQKSPQSTYLKSTLSITTKLFLLLAAFLSGAIFASRQNPTSISSPSGSVPQVPLRKTLRTFKLDPAFTTPPKPNESEPSWDSLIPNGLGYIGNTSDSSSFSVIAVFHQLHCLYTLRRAYYSTSDNELEDFDFGRNRPQHVEHCFEYLRQSLMCSADSSIEPAKHEKEEGFLGWDVPRQCRDYEQLKWWAEQRRAFDARGFLAEELRGHHGNHDQ